MKVAESILKEEDPGKQKALSRKIDKFDNHIWSQAMEDIIEHGLRETFSQNPKLMQEWQQMVK